MPELTQTREPLSLREQSPVGPLTRWVECGWFLDTAEPVSGHRVPPDGCLDIVYEPSLGLRAIGTMTHEQHVHFPKGARVAGVRFRPGMAGAFLGVSPAELTDTSAPLEDLWPRRARKLKQRLDDARSAKDALQILLANLPAPADLTPTQRAIEALTIANGNADLDAAASQANLSPRQFRRRCLQESGLTPKRLCRVLRFRHVCRMAGERDRLNWSAMALEAEYFDQAHLIRDFQEFTGRPPMAVFSNTRAPNPR